WFLLTVVARWGHSLLSLIVWHVLLFPGPQTSLVFPSSRGMTDCPVNPGSRQPPRVEVPAYRPCHHGPERPDVGGITRCADSPAGPLPSCSARPSPRPPRPRPRRPAH